jgi:hypothetical protein
MLKQIEKTSGTYADALEAIGWATLMSEYGLKNIEVRDNGLQFTVSGEGQLCLDHIPQLGFWFVADEKNPPPKIADWNLDYPAERAKEEAQREFEKAAKAGKKKSALKHASEMGHIQPPDAPKPELKLAKMISSMRKGWNSDRDLAVWIDSHPNETTQWVEAAMAGSAFAPCPSFSNTQLLNPATGKGVSAAKSQARSPNSLPDVFIDPFAEWMKLRGLWRAMLAYRSGEDFKFMVVEPGQISPGGIQLLRSELESLNLWGGIRLDIEATLRLTEILILNSDALQLDAPISLKKRRPSSVIRGLRQAFFKSLGTAAALMNEALLPLPAWFDITSKADADAYIKIIHEAIGSRPRGGCLGTLDEDKSDEGALLQQYRSWLASGEFEDLMAFHHEFGALTLRKAAAKEFTRQFSTEVLDDLLIRTYESTQMLTEIIKTTGFQNIARAIRNTTIYAVGLKDKKREVQFGLSQRWRQSIKQGGGHFPTALADFVQANNWEVVHRLEGRGFQVATTDLDQVFELIEKHGEEKVGALLLAYGFSRAPKVPGDHALSGEEPEQEEGK